MDDMERLKKLGAPGEAAPADGSGTLVGRITFNTPVERSNSMYDMENLQKMGALGQGAPAAMAAFQALDKAALSEGAVPVKYKELIALAVALTTQCPYCLAIHSKAAVAAGATPEELAETAFVAVALRAGAALTHGTHLMPS